jgi:hypothetical protein
VDIAIVSELNMSMATPPPGSAGNPTPDARFGANVAELSRIPVEIKKRLGQPLMMVLPVEANGPEDIRVEEARRQVVNYYLGEGIPVFLTLERAVKALSNVIGYYERRDALVSVNQSIPS